MFVKLPWVFLVAAFAIILATLLLSEIPRYSVGGDLQTSGVPDELYHHSAVSASTVVQTEARDGLV